VYGRYGGGGRQRAGTRPTLGGLHFSVGGAPQTHPRQSEAGETALAKHLPAKKNRGAPPTPPAHHRPPLPHVKRSLNTDLEKTSKWSRDLVWRYPLPDNLGLILEIDRGNVVERVEPDSPAARAGLRVGDVVQWLNEISIHSIADAQYALDRAPQTGP